MRIINKNEIDDITNTNIFKLKFNDEYIDDFKILLNSEIGNDFLKAKDEEGRTALFCAVKTKLPNITKLLLEYGASVNERSTSDKVTPLHIAAYDGNISLIKLLLEHNADPYIKDEGGNIPLEVAFANRKLLSTLLLTRAMMKNVDEYENYIINFYEKYVNTI